MTRSSPISRARTNSTPAIFWSRNRGRGQRDIKAQLDDGADFAELAKRESPPVRPVPMAVRWGGSARARWCPNSKQAVVGLEKGQVSDPVQTQFGWHVVILNDKRKSEAPELDGGAG